MGNDEDEKVGSEEKERRGQRDRRDIMPRRTNSERRSKPGNQVRILRDQFEPKYDGVHGGRRNGHRGRRNKNSEWL